MLKHLRELRYQEGVRDRQAGILPKRQDSAYLEGYLNDRPGGLDDTIQYFGSVEAFLKWRSNTSGLPKP